MQQEQQLDEIFLSNTSDNQEITPESFRLLYSSKNLTQQSDQKVRLKLKIQLKKQQIAEKIGKEEPQQNQFLTIQQLKIQKQQQVKENNRASAQKSREKIKQKLLELQNQVIQLQQQNDELKIKLSSKLCYNCKNQIDSQSDTNFINISSSSEQFQDDFKLKDFSSNSQFNEQFQFERNHDNRLFSPSSN